MIDSVEVDPLCSLFVEAMSNLTTIPAERFNCLVAPVLDGTADEGRHSVVTLTVTEAPLATSNAASYLPLSLPMVVSLLLSTIFISSCSS